MNGAEKHSRSGKLTLPVSEYYTVLDHRTYVRNAKTIIALAALQSPHGKELKLYKWLWKEKSQEWKVDLAKLRVEKLDLKQIARDAKDLGERFNIDLSW